MIKPFVFLVALIVCVNCFGATVTINGTVTTAVEAVSGTTLITTYTVPSGTNCLVIMESSGTYAASTPAPTSITYNGVSLTMVPSSSVNRANAESSIWRLVTPPTGAADMISVTYPSSVDTISIGIIPLSNVNTSAPTGTAVTNSGSGTAASVTAAGGGSSDLYLGTQAAGIEGTGVTSGGGQTNLYMEALRGGWGMSGDSIVGGGSGAFSWTESPSQDTWTASAVAFKASGGSSTPVQGGFAISPSN